MIRFDQSICRDFEKARKLEWLETNGLGGFASSTVTGIHTRRYHGLLIAATRPPVGRMLLLSKFEETLIVDGHRFELSANQYPGAIYPRGFVWLKQFRLDPFPVFVYAAGGIEITKRVFMVHGENTTVVEYQMGTPDAAGECFLELRPLIAFRDYHSTTHRNDALNPAVRCAPGLATVAPHAGLPDLNFGHNAETLEPSGVWYFNFEYAEEQARGLDSREDLFNPFVLRFRLLHSTPAAVIASTQIRRASAAASLGQREIERRNIVVAGSASGEPWLRQLTAAADQFIVQRGEWNSIIAGYHWFTDWGRDTMIGLRGLTLMTGRPEIARNILDAFAQNISQGMLPNRFPDAGEPPEYCTADATLWMFEAVRSYLLYTGDFEFIRERLYPKLREVMDWHLRGTRYGIHIDSDGLLCCGEQGIPLTWMDVKIGDWAVTPRTGKPVEIQALWYNALRTLAALAHRFGDTQPEQSLSALAQKAQASFNAQFWNSNTGCLYDVIDGPHLDASIRPNQIFAVSLHHRMLPPEKERRVVDVVQRELLTPLGLRTLSPRDPNYRARYEGGAIQRDSAYHQGTVWPWLMGPYISAYVKTNGHSEAARRHAEQSLQPFIEHLNQAGLGQISELADGDPPHAPKGCIAQAWSVGELLRAAVEDIYELPLRYRTGD